jgi:DNA-binding CsgD family transcriptional regulator
MECTMTISDYLVDDDFVVISEPGLMMTVRRSLEAVGLRVVDGFDDDDDRPVPARELAQLVLVGSESTAWAIRGAVTYKQGRGAGTPVVIVAMFDDEDSARAAMGGGPKAQAAAGPNTLTSREVEVLEALANGASTCDVARSLFISHKTVKNHLAHIYAKLGASSRTQAVATAVRLGIVRIA